MSKSSKTRIAEISFEDDTFIRVSIADGAEQTIADAHDNQNVAFELAGHKRRPLLVDIRGAKPLQPEVRREYRGAVIAERFTHLALLVHASPVGIMMGNIYMKIAKTVIPIQIFTDEAKALQWIRRQK